MTLNNITETMLIIGEGDNEYNQNIINYVSTDNEASKYGTNSKLYKAYKDAVLFGADNIYLLNMLYDTDYPQIVESLLQSSFTYIVPINIKFSDNIYIEKLNRKTYYPEYLIASVCSSNNNSTIIMTDEHASLFETLDDFINYTELNIDSFKNISIAKNKYGKNLCFVANNLESFNYANVIAASMLMSSQFKDYPLHNCGNAVFDIDYHDIRNKEFCFFKYNIKRSATIENFNNFNVINSQDKFVPINRVINFLQKYLDLSEFCGRLYNGYLKILVVDKLDTLLSSIKNTVISDYSILSCEFAKNNITKTVTVLNEIEIIPVNSLEKYKLMVEIKN